MTLGFVDDELAESFCLIPSAAPAKLSSAASAVQQENTALKAELEATKTKLAASEKAMKLRMNHDKELMDSIVMAKREVCSKRSVSAIFLISSTQLSL